MLRGTVVSPRARVPFAAIGSGTTSTGGARGAVAGVFPLGAAAADGAGGGDCGSPGAADGAAAEAKGTARTFFLVGRDAFLFFEPVGLERGFGGGAVRGPRVISSVLSELFAVDSCAAEGPGRAVAVPPFSVPISKAQKCR